MYQLMIPILVVICIGCAECGYKHTRGKEYAVCSFAFYPLRTISFIHRVIIMVANLETDLCKYTTGIIQNLNTKDHYCQIGHTVYHKTVNFTFCHADKLVKNVGRYV